MGARHLIARVWLLLWLVVGTAQAVDTGMGTPFMQQWSRAELQIHTANRKVAQGPNGLIYVGNDNALLEYDGVRWHKYDLPNASRVRDFVFHEGVLYVGTTSDMLVLEPDARGRLQWRSLIADWPVEDKRFGDIWNTVGWGRWVVFLAEEALFVWDGEQVQRLEQPGGELDLLVAAGGRLWVSSRKGRLYQFFPEQLRLQAAADIPAGVRFRDALDWPDGRLLFFSRNHGLWWLEKGRLREAEASIQQPLRDRFLYDAVLLPDGSVAVGTIGHGLLLLDAQLRLVRQLTREDGLFSNVQAAVAVDDQAGLWSVGENGLHRLQWPAPLTRILPGAGEETGGVDQLLLFRGAPLLVANGLVRILQPSPEQSPRLTVLPGSRQQVFAALPLDRHQLLVAREGGFWLAEVDDAWRLHWRQPLQEMLFGWHVTASRLYPGRYYGIGTGGLTQLERDEAGRWQSRMLIAARDMAHRVVEDDQGRVWAGGNIGKIYRYDPAREESAQWTEIDGLPPGNVVPFWLDGQLVIGTTSGLKQLRQGRFVPAAGVPEFLTRDGNEIYRIIRDQRGNYWVRLGDRNGVLEQTVQGWVWNEAPLLPIAASVSVNFFEDAEGLIWIGDGSGQVFRYNPAQPVPVQASPRLRLRRVTARQSGQIIYGGADLNGPWPGLQPEDNALRFEYALSRFTRNDATEYRARLLGMDSRWSNWSRETRWDVTNLGAGEYTLQIQARDLYGQQYQAAIGGLRVLPHWYATSTAKVLYFLLLLLAGYWLFRLGHRWRLHQLEREKMRLSALVDLRTREVRRQARELEKMNEAKSRFFANVSHEFRTPLTLTIGPLETVCKEQADELPENTRRYLQLALANARRMLALVGQILDINRLEAGRMPLRVAEADLAAFLRVTAERFEPRMRQLGLTFVTYGLEDPVLHYYDVDHLDKVVGNLLSNASKFTPHGGRVELHLAVEAGQVVIRVRDTGPGVAEEEKQHLFRRYYQSQRASNVSQPGTGIGLALCKELVMLHHGRIHVRNHEDGGAEFVVELPRGRDHFDPQDLVQPVPEQTTPAVPAEDPLPLDEVHQEGLLENQTTVLVVDDNAELRAFLRMRLEGAFRVVEAADGQQALARMREWPPDVVVTDQMMPGMDGLQLLEAIRADAELMATPVLMLSARSTHRDTVEGLQAGADDYLAKPFDSAELVVRLQALLAHRERLRQQLEQEWQQRQKSHEPPARSLPEGARKLLEVVRQHLHDSGFTVEQMGAEMAMERTTLYRNCREWFDCSPSELLRRERLLRARELLQQGDYSVAEVAYGVGFESQAYFSRCFKQETGMSPSQFRKAG